MFTPSIFARAPFCNDQPRLQIGQRQADAKRVARAAGLVLQIDGGESSDEHDRRLPHRRARKRLRIKTRVLRFHQSMDFRFERLRGDRLYMRYAIDQRIDHDHPLRRRRSERR